MGHHWHINHMYLHKQRLILIRYLCTNKTKQNGLELNNAYRR